MSQWLETMPARTRVALGVRSGGDTHRHRGVRVVGDAHRVRGAVQPADRGRCRGHRAELKKQKVDYQLADGGTTIRVPAERVHDIRLALMSSGTPIAGGVGFEIFDRQGLGATEQSQRVSFQRALQGELARTIGALDGVQAGARAPGAARVHACSGATGRKRAPR